MRTNQERVAMRRVVRVTRLVRECGHEDVIPALEQLKALQEYVRSSASNGCAEAAKLMKGGADQ
jgi:hypothetical protein